METKSASLPLMRLARTSLLLTLLSGIGVAAQLSEVLASMDQAALKFKGLTADVRKVTHTAVINENETESGSVAVRRPKPKDLRALFVVTGENPRRIAYSGHTAEIYYPKMNTIDRYDVDRKLGSQVDKYLLLGFGSSSKDLAQAYNIAYGGPETVAGQKTTRLELTPKAADTATGLTKAELWISDETHIAVQQKLYFRDGGYQLATYTNMKIDPDLPESAVSLNAPRNAKVQYPQK